MSENTLPRVRLSVPRPAVFAALSAPNYRRYWFGLVVYVIGWRIEWVSYGWLIWELMHDPLYLGLYGLVEGVPLVLFQLFGGVFADRAAPVRLLVGTQLCTAATLVLACALTATNLMRVELALALVAVSATFRAFEQPTRMAMIPSLVSRPLLPNAIAIGSMPWQGGRVLGPSLGGILIAAFGTTVSFGVAALAYAVAIALYSRIRLPAGPPRIGGGFLRPLLQGLVFAARHSLISNLILLTFFNSVFGMSYMTLLPIFSDQYLQSGSTGFGLLQAANGLGAIMGTVFLAATAVRLRQRGRVLLLGGIGFGVLLVAFSQASALSPGLALLLLAGLSNTVYLTLVSTALQEQVPNELRGRVMGLFGISYNLVPLGGLLGGAVAAAADARVAVLLGGALVALGTLASLVLNPRLRAMP
ncbi:MAG: MFS transporter [Chloroflexi bacterium]|jgi:MFS family permease|nr:MFS transporter [Chloroflexota bacterium]